jgi:hypothetical protein
VRAHIDSLLLSGYVSRTGRADGAGPRLVVLTLRGTLVLNRATRTFDRELNRRIGSVVSADDLDVVEDALRLLRQRPVTAAQSPSSHEGRRQSARVAGGVSFDAFWI